jgi:hypothetical protein
MNLLNIFGSAERVRTSAVAAYLQNLDQITNDPTPPLLFRQFMMRGMLRHEAALALTLAAFYQKYLKFPATDRAVLCEVSPFFFIEPDAQAAPILAEYCVYLVDETHANTSLLAARLIEAIRASRAIPYTEPIHAEYPEWIEFAINAGSPWLVLLQPDLQVIVRRATESRPSKQDDDSDGGLPF